MQEQHRYLAQCGLPLLRNGYQIVPITPGHKFPAGLADWEVTNATPELLQTWLNNGRVNDGVGVLTRYTPAVDLDIYDANAAATMADWVDQYIGVGLLRIGQAPKRLLVFRTEQPFTKTYSASYIVPGAPLDKHGKPVPSKVEILGDGQQFVSFAIHPDTQRPYQWEGDSLLNVPWHSLDTLDLGQARQICQAFEQLAEQYVAAGLWQRHKPGNWQGSQLVAYTGGTGAGFDPLDIKPPREDVSLEQIRALLQQPGIQARAEDRDNWIKCGAALSHQFGGSDEGMDLWRDWSATAHNYAGDDDIEYRWGTFKNDKSARATTISLLLRWADEDAESAAKFRYDNLQHKLAGVADYEAFADSPLLSEVRNFLRDNPEYKNDVAATLKQKTNAPRIDSLRKAISPGKEINRKHVAIVANADGSGVPNADFEYGENGIIPNQSNANLAIRLGGYGRFAYDEFQGTILYAAPGAGAWRPITDNDYPRALVHLEALGFSNVAKERVKDAVAVIAEENAFDSGKAWAETLRWDGVSRLPTFGQVYLGQEASPYVQAVWFYTWTALAGRLLDPGCKVDMVPVLISGEGFRKSSFVEALAPTPEAFGLLDMAAKEDDISRSMRGKCVMEWAELKGIKGRDEETIKQFVARKFQSWTPKYREFETRFSRRCVFIGTTNSGGILPATGGARRWLPMELERPIDTSLVERDREQLWAEAVAYYRHYGILWQQAEALGAPVREEHREDDPISEDISDWLSAVEYGPQGGEWRRGDKPFRMTDLMAALRDKGVRILQPSLISDRLRRLGYDNKHSWYEGKTIRQWRYTGKTGGR